MIDPNNIGTHNLLHEWVHTQQYKGNLLAIPFSNLNYYQGLLNGTNQGFLDHEADRMCGGGCTTQTDGRRRVAERFCAVS